MFTFKWLLAVFLIPFFCRGEIKIAIIADSIGVPYQIAVNHNYPSILQKKYREEGMDVRILNDQHSRFHNS